MQPQPLGSSGFFVLCANRIHESGGHTRKWVVMNIETPAEIAEPDTITLSYEVADELANDEEQMREFWRRWQQQMGTAADRAGAR